MNNYENNVFLYDIYLIFNIIEIVLDNIVINCYYNHN